LFDHGTFSFHQLRGGDLLGCEREWLHELLLGRVPNKHRFNCLRKLRDRHVYGRVGSERVLFMFRRLLPDRDGFDSLHWLFGGHLFIEHWCFARLDLCELSRRPILVLGSISLHSLCRSLVSSEHGLDSMRQLRHRHFFNRLGSYIFRCMFEL